MPRILLVFLLALALSGCSTQSSAAPSSFAPTVRTVPKPSAVLPALPTPATPTQQPAPAATPATQSTTPTQSIRVVNSYPHDRLAYTQGLVYIGDDSFYEGTGLVGASSLREVALSGEIRRNLPVPDVFGEGVAVVGERIFQLTWQNCVGYIYNRADFARIATFSMPLDQRTGRCLEGWGLTYDGARLILSDGSERLFFVDPDATARTLALAITGQINVRDALGPVVRLNELEYIDGEVFANIWQDGRIARIDPATGAVNAYLDLNGLFALLSVDPAFPPPEVLNGIAYDAEGARLFVTGKHWPLLFEIEIIAPAAWRVYLPLAEAA